MLSQYRRIDLTQTLNSKVLSWDGSCGFQQTIVCDYPQACRVHQLSAMPAGIGTHIDAPLHFIPNATDVASLALENLMVPAHVINVSKQSHADYLISREDILQHEKQHGIIPERHLVIFYTGWSRYWLDAEKYRNKDANGMMHFPSISTDTAELLLERHIVGIGIDTISPDLPGSAFPVHHLLLGADKYIIENIANANLLPTVGAEIIVLPMKIETGTEAPVRIIGLIKK